MKAVAAVVCAVVVAVASVSVFAHEETFKGKVISNTESTVRVDVLDPKTKKVTPTTFNVDKDTKVLRGDAVVTFATAKIRKGENIAVTVNHDDDETLALVVRLDAVK